MEFMDFMTENYIWFTVGGVVIIMALIGFVAEKTDFGRKNRQDKKEKVSKKEVKEENIETIIEPTLENGGQFDVVPDLANTNQPLNTDPLTFPEPNFNNEAQNVNANVGANEDLYAGLDQFANATATPDTNNTATPTVSEDLYAGLGAFQVPTTPNVEAPVADPSLEVANPPLDLNNVSEVSDKGINDVVNDNIDDTVVTDDEKKKLEVVDLEHPDLNLPELDSIAGNSTVEVPQPEVQEDVWKF